MRKCKLFGVAAASACLAGIVLPTSAARADSPAVTAPSTYLSIDVTGPESQFQNVPDAINTRVTPGPDANATIDPVELKITNDSGHIYFDLDYNTSVNPYPMGIYLAIDSDANPTTGDAIYGSPNIGSNTGFENDFAFSQTASDFNSSSATPANAPTSASEMYPYKASPYDTSTLYQLISLPLDLYQDDTSTGGYVGYVFPQGQTFALEFYTVPTDGSDAVELGVVDYTLASTPTPEPASLGLIGIAGAGLLRRRSRRCQTISA